MVDLLLEKCVDLNSKIDSAQASLSLAESKKHEAVAKDVFQKSDNYGQPWVASENGYQRMIELLKSRIGYDFKDEYHQITKSLAFKCERKKMNFLLEISIRIDSQYGVSKASEYGHEAVVKLLLKQLINLETKD